MLSHDDLVDVFGDDGVTLLDFDEALELGMSELDALILSHVGLPSDVGALFTTELTEGPGLFSVQPFDNPDAPGNAALFIGAPRNGQACGTSWT